MGEKAENRMQTCILSCLPCKADDARTVLESRQAMKVLGDGKLFAFCGAGVRASWSTVAAFLQALSEGKCPAWEQTSETPFWSSIKGAFANFLSVTLPGGEGSTTSQLLRGAAAASHLMGDFLARKAKDTDTKFAYGELSKLMRFGWLLTAAQKATLEGWLNESLAQTITRAGTGGPSATSTKRVNNKQKNKDMTALVGGLFK